MKSCKYMYSFIFLILMGSVGCKKDTPAQPQPPAQSCGDTVILNKLYGEWEWVKKEYSNIAGPQLIDINSCQCNIKMVIYENCILRFYKNNVLQETSSYKIPRAKCPTSIDTVFILRADEIKNKEWYFLEGDQCITIYKDTLELSYFRGGDAFGTNYYVKINNN